MHILCYWILLWLFVVVVVTHISICSKGKLMPHVSAHKRKGFVNAVLLSVADKCFTLAAAIERSSILINKLVKSVYILLFIGFFRNDGGGALRGRERTFQYSIPALSVTVIMWFFQVLSMK